MFLFLLVIVVFVSKQCCVVVVVVLSPSSSLSMSSELFGSIGFLLIRTGAELTNCGEKETFRSELKANEGDGKEGKERRKYYTIR